MPYGAMGGTGGQQLIEICTGYRGTPLLKHIGYGVVRCWCDWSRRGRGERRNGAYFVSVGEKKRSLYTGIYLAGFTLDKGLSHSSLLWLVNVSMRIPSDFTTNQLIEAAAQQSTLLLDFVR
jgi:hypothetical protein